MIIGEIYNSPVLTDYVVKYNNSEYVGTRALPIVPVPKLEGKYTKFDKKNMFKRENTLRPHNSEAGHSDYRASRETFACEAHAWKDFLARVDYDNAEPPVADQMGKAEFCANTILLDQEIRIKDLIFASGSYAAANRMTLTAAGTSDGYQFDQYTAGTGTLFTVVENAVSKCFRPPNADLVVLINEETFRLLKHHPDVLARITGGATKEQPASVMLQTLAELFEADEVLVGRAKYDSTAKRTTGTYSYIWDRHMLVFYRARTPGRDATQLGSTFSYTPGNSEGVVQVEGASNGWRARKWYDPAIGGGSDVIEVEHYVDEVVVCSDCACLVQNCIGSTTPTV